MDEFFVSRAPGSGKEAFVKAVRELQEKEGQEKGTVSLVTTEAPALRPYHDLFPGK